MVEAAFLDDPSLRLEAAYRRIRVERMEGLPMLNAALDVAAVGFAPREECWLGVMITPWFMNLMQVPRDRHAWMTLPPGRKRIQGLPGGEYEFIGGRDPLIGDYRMCSLFSPMFEFRDMPAALLTARLALEAVLDLAHGSSQPLAPDSGRGAVGLAGPAADDPRPRPAAPVSKRDFLRGSFLRRGDRG